MSTESKPKVTILPKVDGPYVVQNLERLANSKGPLSTRPTMALCRCGHSNNKPFCDGSHSKNGFSSAKGENRLPDRVRDYTGTQVTVHDNRSICAHAAYCTEGLPSVFREDGKPWIDPDGATADEVIAAVRRCPSGALTVSGSGINEPEAQSEPSVFVAPNGPYVVKGATILQDTALATRAPADRLTLCRCGGSSNKPFCDGSHWSNGFADEKN